MVKRLNEVRERKKGVEQQPYFPQQKEKKSENDTKLHEPAVLD